MSRDLRKIDGDLELIEARVASIATTVNDLRAQVMALLSTVSDARARIAEEAT